MIRFARTLAPSLLAAVLVAGCASSPDSHAGSVTSSLTAPVTVFADALGTGWSDWSWGTHNLANTSPVASGSRSISFTYGPWEGLYFHSSGTSFAGLSTLELDVDGGTTANPALAIYTTVSGAQQTRLALNGYCKGGVIPSGAFTHCSVPLSALGVASATVDGIVIQENAGKTLPALYVDSVSVAPPPVPAAPTGLLASTTPSDVTLSWNAVAGATGYRLYRATGSGASTLLASPAAANYRDLAVAGGTSYTYAVSAVGSGGEGPRSAAVTTTVPAASFVYRDALASPWIDGSWSTHNLANTTPVAVGTRSISSSFGAWEALYFMNPGLSTGGFTALTLRVNGGSTAGAALHVRAVVNGTPTAGTDLGPTCSGGTIPANAWTLCTVPMSAIAPAGATITGIEIQEWRGGTIPTMYFDEVGLLGTSQVQPPVTVAVNPSSASLTTGGSSTFTATVANASNTSVTWSVKEGAAGGSVTAAGVYTAPAATGTFHVVATSAADPTATATATVTVTAPATVSVAVNPSATSLNTGTSMTFTATVTGSSNTAVTWSVKEGATGGSITAGGVYTAPAGAGTYHVVATSAASPAASATATATVSSPSTPPSSGLPGSDILSADRITTWNPGVVGGVPSRSTVCATVQAASCGGNGASDATACIQAAINACPAGQVVSLSAGTFLINSGNIIMLNKGITLRGAGAGKTFLTKTDGAQPNTEAVSATPSPIVIVGPGRWSMNNDPNAIAGSINLAADAVKEATSVTLASVNGLKVGQHVVLDELSGASWQPDPTGRGQVWASPDFRVVWQFHNPGLGIDDPLIATTPTSGNAASWFSRQDRPTSEVKQIASISGNTVTFSTPVHISYRVSHTAQVAPYGYDFVTNAGLEDVSVKGGDNGNVRFQWCDSCWAARVENSVWHDEGFAIDNSMRVEIRESYVHDAAWPEPGGAGYAISLSHGSSEALIENSIIVKANKVMVARSSGAGSVFGYNYADDGYIFTNLQWIEVGLNASHMVGSHHVLFEGNYAVNFDSDNTHGNAIYHTVFRNQLRGVRRDYNDTVASGDGPLRCIGSMSYSYWHSFVGNVLGAQGQMTGWTNEADSLMQNATIWKLGWDGNAPYPVDPNVAARSVRHGNFDYLSNAVHWDPSIASHTLPSSLYLKARPAFFDAGRGYQWPWVDPTAASPVATLPAKARYDAGTPFTQP